MNLGFLGAGHIALALARGWATHAATPAPSLHFFDVDGERARAAAAATGGVLAATADALVDAADVVVVAVRPPDVEPLLAAIAPRLGERALVSVAAGVSLDRLCACLPAGARVARVMPNVAARLGLGVFLFVPGTLGPATEVVHDAFATIGLVAEVEEGLFDVATAVAGCMPGFMARLAAAFTAAGERRGLEPETAARLALAALHGAAAVLADEGDAAALIAAAATPGGMTAAGIAALEAHGLPQAVDAAVGAAAAQAARLA
jgi:pyrroline-5-carboxylate reductase